MTKQDLQDIRLGRESLKSGHAKRVREQSNLTRAEVAAHVGATEDAVALWEAGKRSPRSDAARKMGRLIRQLAEAS